MTTLFWVNLDPWKRWWSAVALLVLAAPAAYARENGAPWASWALAAAAVYFAVPALGPDLPRPGKPAAPDPGALALPGGPAAALRPAGAVPETASPKRPAFPAALAFMRREPFVEPFAAFAFGAFCVFAALGASTAVFHAFGPAAATALRHAAYAQAAVLALIFLTGPRELPRKGERAR